MRIAHIIAWTAVVWCNASLLWRGAGAQLNPVPPCDMVAAQTCVSYAQQSEAASGCNWYILVPAMSSCVNSAVAGCMEDEQLVWVQIVADYNTTLQSDGCYAPCTSQAARMTEIQTCFAYVGGSVDGLVATIASTPNISPQDPNCQALSTLNTCLTTAASGCPALMDLTYDLIYSANQSGAAYAACGVTSLVAATTNAPVALLNPLSMTPPAYLASTTSSGSSGGMDQGQLILIILGSIMIAATIVVIIAVIILTIRRRRAVHRRSILRDWRPNGQQVYMDDPRLVSANQGAQFIQGGQVRSGQAIFRPVNYANNSGFLNEGAAFR